MRVSTHRGLAAFVGVMILAGAVFGPRVSARQTTLGNLTGVVKDAREVVIPNVTIQVRNEDTGQTQSQSTNASGGFFFAMSPGAKYKLTAEMSGFKRTVISRIPVRTGDVTELGVKLEVGASDTTVTFDAIKDRIANVEENPLTKTLPLLDRQDPRLVRPCAGRTGCIMVRGAPSRASNEVAKPPETLVSTATLIVDATVESIAATVKAEQATFWNSYITDVTLHVNRVIKGQNDSDRVLVSQALGSYDGMRITSVEYGLMEIGKRYVLFLVPEPSARTKAFSITPTTPRYSIIDEFVGLFDANGLKVGASPGLTGSWRAHYENMTPDELIAETERLSKPPAR